MRALLAALLLAASTAAAATLDFERPIAPARIGPSPWQSTVQSATDGRNFLITWDDSRCAIPANVSQWPTLPLAQLVDPSGNVLTTIALPFRGVLLWFAGSYLWISGDRYIRISRDGAVIDTVPRPFPITNVSAFVVNGSHLLAVTTTRMTFLTATLLDSDLNVLRSADVAETEPTVPVAVASGSGFAIFYDVHPQNAWPGIRAVLLDGGVNVVRSFEVMTFPGIGWVHAATDGNNILVLTTTWQVGPSDSIFLGFAFAMIDRNGNVQGAPTQFGQLVHAGYGIGFDDYALAATRGGYQFVSSQLDGGQMTVSMMPFGTDGFRGPSTRLFVTNAPPTHYALLANGAGRMMLLWSHGVSGGAAGQEVFDGELYDDASDFAAHRNATFRLGDGPLSQESLSAAVSRDATALVAWRERTGASGPLALYAARLAADGTVLDRDSLRLADSTSDNASPAVASDGRDFLVAWSEPEHLVLRRVAADGRVSDESSIYLGPGNTSSPPALAWNGSEFLLAFHEGDYSATRATYTWTTKVVRLDASGAPIGQPLAINAPLSTSIYSGTPLLASDGRDFLLVYTQQSVSAIARISADGNPTVTAVPIALAAPKTLFWSGTTYVALEPARGGFYGVRITSEALPLDGLPGGGEQSTGPMLPGLPSDFAAEPLCDASGCYAAGTSLQDGMLNLLTWRVVDANGAFDRGDPVLAGTASAPFTNGSGGIVLTGPTPRLVYIRVAPEAMNATRIFVRTPLRTRHRAAGH